MNIKLSPALSRFVDDQVKDGRFLDASDLVRVALRRMSVPDGLPGTRQPEGSTDSDIMALAFLAMKEAAESAQEDLRAIMQGVKAINAAKRALRELLDKVSRDVAANSASADLGGALDFSKGLGQERAYHRALLPSPDRDAPGGVRFVSTDLYPGKLGRVAELETIQDSLQGKLDGLSEMGEMESLRLQMAMDRLSRMMSTLANLLKKAGDTAAAITQNLR